MPVCVLGIIFLTNVLEDELLRINKIGYWPTLPQDNHISTVIWFALHPQPIHHDVTRVQARSEQIIISFHQWLHSGNGPCECWTIHNESMTCGLCATEVRKCSCKRVRLIVTEINASYITVQNILRRKWSLIIDKSPTRSNIGVHFGTRQKVSSILWKSNLQISFVKE